MAVIATITNDWIASRAGWTPYDGVRVVGWPGGAVVRGRQVMQHWKLAMSGIGQPIIFLKALPS